MSNYDVSGKVKQPEKVKQAAGIELPPEVRIKNIYSTRVVVRDAPSGQVYDFQPGQVLPVKAEDKTFLLAMVRKASACCGNSASARRYFEEV